MALYYKDKEFGYRPEVRAILPWRFFIFSLFFALTCFVLYFLFSDYLFPSSSKAQEEIKEKTSQLGKEISQKERQQVLVFYSQVRNLEALLSSHVYLSSLLAEKIEKNLLPQVSLRRISIEAPKHFFSLQGETNSKEALLKQVVVFEKDKDFSKVEVGNLSYGKNVINFSLKVYFEPEIIRYNKE